MGPQRNSGGIIGQDAGVTTGRDSGETKVACLKLADASLFFIMKKFARQQDGDDGYGPGPGNVLPEHAEVRDFYRGIPVQGAEASLRRQAR